VNGPAWDVIGIGANSVDRVVVLPAAVHTLGASGKMPIVERSLMCGGETATLLCACASFGLRGAYIGVVGADAEGRLVRDTLASRGVDVSDVREHPTATRGSVVLVNRETGDRIVLSDRNQGLNFQRGDISPQRISSARVVHVDDADQDAGIAAAALAASANIPVTSDIDKVSDRTEALAASVTYPIFDGQAPVALTGAADPEQALRKLRRLNPGLLCMTLGATGAAVLDGDRFFLSPGFAVNVVDTTGAGDVFRAGFIYGLLQGWPVPELLRFANAAAALSCTKLGAIASVPALDDVTKLYRGEHREHRV
jgi:sulfofructose kinase